MEASNSGRRARCESCHSEWPLEDTVFYCSCGHRFTAHEVREALSTASLMRRRLISQIESMSVSDLAIETASRDSLSSWLESVTHQLGEVLGRAVGKAVRWWRENVT